MILGRPARSLLFLVAWVALDWVSFIHQFAHLGITPWNPPPGLGLAVLVVAGRRAVPLVFAGALLAEVLVRSMSPLEWSTLASAAGIALVYGAAAAALRRIFHVDPGLTRLTDVFSLAAVTVVASAVIAIVYVVIYTLAGELAPSAFLEAALRYWIGDMIGVAVLTPLLLVFRRIRFRLPTEAELLEWLIQAMVLMVVLWVVFGPAASYPYRIFYLLFLPLTWVAVRFGAEGAVVVNLAAQIGVLVAVQVEGQESTTVISFQFLLLALSGATLVLGAAISDRRRVEAALLTRRAEFGRLARLSTAGEMAASLAHELNQPLMAVVAFSRASQRFLGADPPEMAKAAAATDRAVAEAQRAGDIIRSLREFIGTGRTTRAPQDPARLIAETLALVEPECGRTGIRLIPHVDKSLPSVHVDKVQVQQVVLNLVRNAMDSLGRRPGGGAITVSARRGAAAVEVEVRDNGPGIDADQVERLFVPFNTSKATGMGLGLSISRGFVESHGGRLWLASNGPGGASFRFTLPTEGAAAKREVEEVRGEAQG